MWDLAGMTEKGKWMHGTEYGEQPAFPFTHITYIPIFRRQLGSARFFLSLSLSLDRPVNDDFTQALPHVLTF